MAFKLAELFVDIKARDSEFKGQLESTRQGITTWGVAVGTAVGSLTASAIRAAAGGIADFFANGIKGAVDLQETLSKTEAIFGQSAGTIIAAADEMAAKYGTLKGPFIDAAASFGAAFKGAGRAASEAAGLGVELTKLGMDMASLAHTSDQEVFTALQAALRGEFDPLERFTVFLSAAKVENEALASGLASSKGQITDLAKQQATLNLIMRGTVDQQGDLERTADSSANSWKRFQGSIMNAAVELGTKLEPALNSVLRVGNELIDGLGPGLGWLGDTFTWLAEKITEGAETVGFVFRNMGAIWEAAQLRATETFANIVVAAQTLAENVGRIASWIGRNWYQLIADGFTATSTVFANFGENLGALAAAVFEFFQNPTGGFNFDWKPLLDGFKATVEELPELAEPVWVDMGDQIDAVFEEVGRKELDRTKRIAAAKKDAVPKPEQGAAANVAKDTFKSQILDTADFARRLRSSILGGDDTSKKQLAAQEKIAKNTNDTNDLLKKRQVAVLA